MKNFGLLPIAFLFLNATISAQVGVNTTTPNTTMDVSAKRDSGGNITDNTQFIGLQAPRLTRAELTANTATYGANQQGAQIYITDVSGGTATGQRVNITTTGYYTFDGTLWQRMQDTNIYTGDGTLTGNRILTHAGKSLTFTNIPNSGQKTVFLNNVGVGIQQDSGAGTRSDISLSNGGTYQSHWFSDTNSPVQFTATNSATSLSFYTTFTTASAPIIFSTSNGGNTVGTEKMRITGTGNIGINTSTPTEKLDNAGIARVRTLPLDGTTNAIFTTSGGTASASQDQTFTATKTVVADANGVMGSVNWVAAPPAVMAGADGVDAVTVTQTIKARSGVQASTTMASKSFTLTKKSLVTIHYALSIGNILAYDGTNLVDGASKKYEMGINVDGSFMLGTGTPFTNSSNSGSAIGVFENSGSRTFVLNAGTHTVDLYGSLYANDTIGIQATFGTSSKDELDILAVPIP